MANPKSTIAYGPPGVTGLGQETRAKRLRKSLSQVGDLCHAVAHCVTYGYLAQ
jgi:hypothetical protein